MRFWSSPPTWRPTPRPPARLNPRIEARTDELQALRELGTLTQAEPRTGDEAVRDLLTRRAGHYVQAGVDARFAHALDGRRIGLDDTQERADKRLGCGSNSLGRA